MIFLTVSPMALNDENIQNQPIISDEMQKELNKPLPNPKGIPLSDQQFMEKVIKFVNEGKIDLYKPDSVINHAIYDRLELDLKAKVELESSTILSIIREMKGLYDAGYVTSFQIQNLVLKLKAYVSDIEETGGDVFII